MIDYTTIITNAVKNAPIGHNVSIVCPKCAERKGTMELDKKLYIVRELGLIKYNCFSASCDLSGYIGDAGSVGKAGAGKHFVPKFYSRPLSSLTSDNEILVRYNISEEEASINRWKHAFVDNYLYLPIMNAYGAQVGDYLKRLGEDDGRPKNLVFKHVDYPLLHFPIGENDKPVMEHTLVLVEDPISALIVNRIQPTAALLGTHLPMEIVFLLRGFNLKGLVLFLDSNATGKSLAYRNKFNHLMPMMVLPAPKGYDPKDLSNSELLTMINKVKELSLTKK